MRCPPNVPRPGLGTNPDPGVISILLPIISPGSIYAPEVASIEEDGQLRGAVAAYYVGQIRRFAEVGSCPADAADAEYQTTICEAACNALLANCTPALRPGIWERAGASANSAPMLRACLDRLLEEPCGVNPGPAGRMLRSEAVAVAVTELHVAYAMSTEPGPSLLLQCLQSAAAASIWWLQKEPIDTAAAAAAIHTGGQRFLLLVGAPSPTEGVGQLLTDLTYSGPRAVNFELPGQMLEALKTCEGLLRMAALLPESLHFGGPGPTVVQILEHVSTLLEATAFGIPRNGINSRDERTAAVMLVQTAVKCALKWPGANASPSSGFQRASERLVKSMLMLANTVSGSAISHPDIPGLAPHTAVVRQVDLRFVAQAVIKTTCILMMLRWLCRRWQGAALALLHATASLEGAGCQWLYHAFNPLLTALLRWKAVRVTMLSSEGGLGTLVKSYDSLLVKSLGTTVLPCMFLKLASGLNRNVLAGVQVQSGPGNSHDIPFIMSVVRLKAYAADHTELALAFARIGVLSKMAQWGEANCGMLSSGQVRRVSHWKLFLSMVVPTP